jgi:DNA-binding CsgD family transcriptional regulator
MIDAFLLYSIVSLLLGISAIAVILILFLKARNSRLVAHLVSSLFLSALMVVLCFNLYNKKTGQFPALLKVMTDCIPFACCGLVYSWPKMFNPAIKTPWTRGAELFFTISAGLMAVYFAIFGYTPYAGFMVIALFADLSLALLYLSLNVLLRRGRPSKGGALRHYERAIRFISALSLLLFPALLAIDFYRGFIPFIARAVPKGLHVLPAFYLLASIGALIGSAREILEPGISVAPATPSEDFVKKYKLTKREAEIIPFLLEFLSYRQIGEKLYVSVGTVRTHLIHIYQKTGVKSRLGLLQMIQREEARKAVAAPQDVSTSIHT